MNRRLAVLLSLTLVVTAVFAQDPLQPIPNVAPTIATISGNPLTVIVGSDTSFQLINSQFPGNGQIFPGSCTTSVADAGIFAAINGTLYSPDFNSHVCSSAADSATGTPWTLVSMTPVVGTGTSSDPYRVTVVADAGTSGVRLKAIYVREW